MPWTSSRWLTFAGAAASVDDTPPLDADGSAGELDEPSHRELARLCAEAADTSAARDEAQRALIEAADRAAREAAQRVHDLEDRLARYKNR